MPAQKRTATPAHAPGPDRALTDWDRLRTLLALRRGGTLSAAARSLGVDHTTVARRLDSLERDLDTPLFTRTPDGFTPTPTGEQLLA
ncbi:LysR family transcriptional regulator, partial [Roseomonas sp. DSM 102946]|nr:LysR family transcriptional regulator [Roseomonas sp. DSM 102946]